MQELTRLFHAVHSRVDSNTFAKGIGNLKSKSTLILCQSRLYSLARDSGFGLWSQAESLNPSLHKENLPNLRTSLSFSSKAWAFENYFIRAWDNFSFFLFLSLFLCNLFVLIGLK